MLKNIAWNCIKQCKKVLEIICLEQQDNKFQNGLWKIDFD